MHQTKKAVEIYMKTSGLLQVKHFDKLLSSVKIEKK